MSAHAPLPRRFGLYLLTAALGQDALGFIFRALRVAGDRGFVRLRIFESPDVSEDAVLDAIEENGEIHAFLKNPAIARGVQMDAVDGSPFLAWNEPNGRTLDALIAKARQQRQRIPVEHALLVGEKVATALEHAYNTMLDGERTLHGLVWPGFVSISDDGETRLTGFGLAAGFFPSIGRPRFAHEIAVYLAPEERTHLTIAKNSDVYSVGVILFELLFGRLPSAADPLGDLKTASRQGPGIPPEAVAVLRTCLSPSESRYQTSGDLRRELGKILFSGPYSPSTFNLAFFISSLFGAEIDAENRDRAREAEQQFGAAGESVPILPRPAPRPPDISIPAPVQIPHSNRRPLAIGAGLLLAAAVAGTILLITRRPTRDARPIAPGASATARPLAAAPRAPTAAPTSPPTTGMSESQFKEEVASRVAAELKRIEDDLHRRGANAAVSQRPQPSGRAAPEETKTEQTEATAPETPPELPRATPATEPASVAASSTSAGGEPEAATPGAGPSTGSPVPPINPETRAAQDGQAATEPEEPETPPKIARVVKPIYPDFALRARIKGIVVLRVLVSETGSPQRIQVLKGIGGGLTEAAVAAVRRWKFDPARKNGQPVSGWTTIPIPFEP